MIVNPVSQTMKEAMARTRPHLIAAAGFSALVNLLFVVPTIYMLQIYDRVVPTRGLQTLLFITLVLLFALATLSLLDRIRTRLLVRASVELDAVVAPRLLDATLGRPDMPEARSALRDFDTREVRVTEAIMQHARTVYLVTDHSKVGRPALVRQGHLSQVHALFTDKPLPPEMADTVAAAGTQVYVAE